MKSSSGNPSVWCWLLSIGVALPLAAVLWHANMIGFTTLAAEPGQWKERGWPLSVDYRRVSGEYAGASVTDAYAREAMIANALVFLLLTVGGGAAAYVVAQRSRQITLMHLFGIVAIAALAIRLTDSLQRGSIARLLFATIGPSLSRWVSVPGQVVSTVLWWLLIFGGLTSMAIAGRSLIRAAWRLSRR